MKMMEEAPSIWLSHHSPLGHGASCVHVVYTTTMLFVQDNASAQSERFNPASPFSLDPGESEYMYKGCGCRCNHGELIRDEATLFIR